PRIRLFLSGIKRVIRATDNQQLLTSAQISQPHSSRTSKWIGGGLAAFVAVTASLMIAEGFVAKTASVSCKLLWGGFFWCAYADASVQRPIVPKNIVVWKNVLRDFQVAKDQRWTATNGIQSGTLSYFVFSAIRFNLGYYELALVDDRYLAPSQNVRTTRNQDLDMELRSLFATSS